MSWLCPEKSIWNCHRNIPAFVTEKWGLASVDSQSCVWIKELKNWLWRKLKDHLLEFGRKTLDKKSYKSLQLPGGRNCQERQEEEERKACLLTGDWKSANSCRKGAGVRSAGEEWESPRHQGKHVWALIQCKKVRQRRRKVVLFKLELRKAGFALKIGKQLPKGGASQKNKSMFSLRGWLFHPPP